MIENIVISLTLDEVKFLRECTILSENEFIKMKGLANQFKSFDIADEYEGKIQATKRLDNLFRNKIKMFVFDD